jgi:hypothetical protein
VSLQNEHDHAVRVRLAEAIPDSAIASLVLERLRAHATMFRVEPDAAGLELQVLAPEDGRPRRARCKLFCPDTRRLAAFFYKSSQVPGSRTRYAYGVAHVLVARLGAEQVDAWLEYAASGLDPRLRPEGMLHATPFEVPEDP